MYSWQKRDYVDRDNMEQGMESIESTLLLSDFFVLFCVYCYYM